jgi:hypothetical protein
VADTFSLALFVVQVRLSQNVVRLKQKQALGNLGLVVILGVVLFLS